MFALTLNITVCDCSENTFLGLGSTVVQVSIEPHVRSSENLPLGAYFYTSFIFLHFTYIEWSGTKNILFEYTSENMSSSIYFSGSTYSEFWNHLDFQV